MKANLMGLFVAHQLIHMKESQLVNELDIGKVICLDVQLEAMKGSMVLEMVQLKVSCLDYWMDCNLIEAKD